MEVPTIFLDKSPRIVAYQLGRLDNQRLLLVPRATDDPKYLPVYEAILTRAGMSPKYRQEALQAIAELSESEPTDVLLAAIAGLDPRSRQETQTVDQLVDMLLTLPAKELRAGREALLKATGSDQPRLRSVAHAALITSGKAEAAWERAQDDPEALLDWLAAIPQVPSAAARIGRRDRVVSLIRSETPVEVTREAITALGAIPDRWEETFRLVAPVVDDAGLREAAVRTLLAVPREARDRAVAEVAVRALVEYAEATPAEDRTSDAFVDAMQLADGLLAAIPVADAKAYRSRLREVTVRVVRIRTIEEEMRYDTPYFAVEAGRPVQVILENDDLMPHNLVVTVPGALKEVAKEGLAVGPRGGWQGKQYVPDSDQVLFATDAVQPHAQYRLTFDAPKEPGEYPYVCTFPQHWYRMHGVMVVVDDLDAWLQDPTEPADPIGSNRSFVQAWTVHDFDGQLESGLRGRTPEIGKQLFAEASCAGCHRVGGEGGAIGPELRKVFSRWKGDAHAVLREILEPSHRIDDKYAMHLVLTVDGQTVSGIVTEATRDSVTVVASPEAEEPTVIAQDDIEEMVKTSQSMMPKSLLDRYTRDEILEILAYLKSVDPQVAAP